MSTERFRQLVAEIAALNQLPIEIDFIRDKIVATGIQDSVKIVGCSADTGQIKGAFYQYVTRRTVYGDQELCTLIVYNTNLDLPWQRVVAAKELVHIFDRDAERTTPQELSLMIDKLLGPLSTEDPGIADLLALTDKLALYQSLPLLFPATARDTCKELLATGATTIEKIALRAVLPLPFVRLVLSDDWPGLLETVLDGEVR